MSGLSSLNNLTKRVQELNLEHKLPPVHQWNPPFCGEIDMRIKKDGSWHYMGTPIGRPAMVRLFSTVLRHDDDGHYYLVTPVEKVRIQVDDAPFVATEVRKEIVDGTALLIFSTNVGDHIPLDAKHPLKVEIEPVTEQPRPYLRVRDLLDALICRPLFYYLLEIAEQKTINHQEWLGLESAADFHLIAPVPDL